MLGTTISGQDDSSEYFYHRVGKKHLFLTFIKSNLSETDIFPTHLQQWASVYTSKGYHHTCGRTNTRQVRYLKLRGQSLTEQKKKLESHVLET